MMDSSVKNGDMSSKNNGHNGHQNGGLHEKNATFVDKDKNGQCPVPNTEDLCCYSCMELCPHTKDMEKRERRSGVNIWMLLTLLFAITAISLFIALISVLLSGKEATMNIPTCDDNPDATAETIRPERSLDEIYTRTKNGDVFEELSKDEIDAVVTFLHSDPGLKLVELDIPPIDSNFIHSIEMKMPNKDDVLAYLNGISPRPERKATAFIFRGADDPPSVDEYVIGGIGGDMYAQRLITDKRTTNIPFIYRPFSTSEFFTVFKNVLPKIVRQAGHVLKESYDAMPMKCGDKCLKLSMAPVSSGFLPEGKRKAWFWFQYDLEFASVRPLDFQFLMDTTSVNPKDWTIENIWYANKMFPNITNFLEQYDQGLINKTRVKFPTSKEDRMYGSMEFRAPLMPSAPLPAPRQFEPSGKRFRITGNEIHYMNWKLNFRVSTSGGLHLMNVRFNQERILYELSMQEVAVMYSGESPVVKIMNYADGAGMYGTRYRGLLPGVDCPGHAEFVDTYLYAASEKGGRIYENAFCVFELNTHSPLRRHRAYSRSGAIYGGLEATAMVIRAVVSVANYDYVFDFMFYQNGAIETKTSMTGFLGTTFHFPEEDQYGTHVYQNVAAPLHNHLFNFKVDLDIKGTDNVYETIDIKSRQEHSPFMLNGTQYQTYIERNLKETEQDALYKYNFDTPKIHVFSNRKHVSNLGNPRGYRVEIQKMSKQVVPEGYGFEPSVSWARYQMAVTKYWPEEERSTSIFTMWDGKKPVVDFQKYLADNDSLVDKDLVAWITVGTQHLPQTENLPVTNTIGSQLSFHILPYNYFDEDPSMHSRDAVRITPRSKDKALEGAVVEHYGAFSPINCVPAFKYPTELLQRNSTFLFS